MNKFFQQTMVLELLKENPFITEKQMAEKTGLSLKEVIDQISTISELGEILSQTHVMNVKKHVLCIGGANIDRKIQVTNKLVYGTSNPSKTTLSGGGVARNIAENLGRLGCSTALLSLVGSDPEGEWLLERTKNFVDITPTEILLGQATGAYTALLDQNGEMAIAFADMDINERATESLIDSKWKYASSSKLVLLDTNFAEDVLSHILVRCRNEGIELCLVPVSTPKVKKLPKQLDGVTWFIGNQAEAEALSGMKINSEGDFFKCAETILSKGVKKVVISRGDKGLIFFTQDGEAGVVLPPDLVIDDVTGAGDALVAGILFSYMKGLNIENACKIGVACSIITLQSHETVSPILNNLKLQETFRNYFG